VEEATHNNHHLVHVLTYLTIDLLRMAKGIFENSKYSKPEYNENLWSRWRGTLEKSKKDWIARLSDEGAQALINHHILRELKNVFNENLHGKEVFLELSKNQKEGPKYFATKVIPIRLNEGE
jgi:hypothetical protein